MPKIALVDDEQSILTSVSLSLESEGYTVDTFLNGVEALEALESKSYDLGLFDIKMPKMDGNELLSKVRSSKIENLKDLPIIFLTSKDHEQDEIIGLRMGASDYIKKPFSQKLLNERIRTVLRIHNNRTEEQKDNNIKKQNVLQQIKNSFKKTISFFCKKIDSNSRQLKFDEIYQKFFFYKFKKEKKKKKNSLKRKRNII